MIASGRPGRRLIFNGHLDTSYSGHEPWLTGPGFKPHARIADGRLWGLGISNMKGALACYIEVVRVLREVGVKLRGDSESSGEGDGERGRARMDAIYNVR